MEEALESLRLTSRRLFSSSPASKPTDQRKCLRSLSSKFLTKKSLSTKNSNPTLLEIPPEIRLLIYSYLAPSSSFQNPAGHPMYSLLHVNRFLRDEIASLLYTMPRFTFSDSRACEFFLQNTKAHLGMLEGLTISICGNDTFSLEPIWKLLVEEKAPIRSLVLRLMLVLGEGEPANGMPDAEVCLDPVEGVVVLGEARKRARKMSACFDTFPIEMIVDNNDGPSTSGNDLTTTVKIGTSADLTASPSSLSRLPLRYLALDGHPTGPWATEFELAILSIHQEMFAKAQNEGRRMLKGPSPLPPGYRYEAYWLHNDAWIEGEEKPSVDGLLRENYGVWRGVR